MASLQRSSVSFRRQGSSGNIWDDPRHPVHHSAPITSGKRYQSEISKAKKTALAPHSSESSPSKALQRRQRCVLSAVFGKCMGSTSS
ncbi:hypothetical protein IFM89_034144 [Coptis chinensis]|uniref:Uncharacterized protein n=1 Tax=Coptis chinensis TaxID=261450 RepID=A0A835I1J3_9MAGN|nr:hypothetical protein IFM89_034144 [Coptis chinensis]